MGKDLVLTEQVLRDIVLCDPVTRGGKEALSRLNLNGIIDETFFFTKLHVLSKYDQEKQFVTETDNEDVDQHCLYYRYTSSREQFDLIQNRVKEFNSRFSSNIQNEYPLLLLGVAGNGKTIEVNYRIFQNNLKNTAKYENVYIDLEKSFTKKTHGVTFDCPNQTCLWLFCIKLLEGTFQQVKKYGLLCSDIFDNYIGTIANANFANEIQRAVFYQIKEYGKEKNENMLFSSLIDLINKDDVAISIRNLVEILMWIQYCVNPKKKHYIVFDNIEQYILLNNSKIQVFDNDISIIFKSINEAITNLVSDFDQIEEGLGWSSFKVIIVLRRTSLGLIDPSLLQAPVKGMKNTTDITGHFQVTDIWKEKKIFIWDSLLKPKYNNEKNTKIIDIFDALMQDGRQTLGTDYQSIIAPLMSYGIRRNAISQVHAAFQTYDILSDNKARSIDYNSFCDILAAASSENHAVKYMYRRALVEFQFKWSILSSKNDRWKKLNIGHLVSEEKITYDNKRIITEKVGYYANNHVSLLHRVLSFLSIFSESNTFIRTEKSVDDMFSTISLYELIDGVLLNPTKKNSIDDEDYLQLANVLIGASNMSFSETRSAPFVILGINDKNFHENPNEIVLKQILKRIKEAGKSQSEPGQRFNCSEFGIRITEAGYTFLLDWQSSFSFMVSLHCFTIPPLFFLKDVSIIKYVIEKVYNASESLYKMYENEAKSFCGEGITLKDGMYLLRHRDREVTFKQRMRELHIDHLNLYRNYLEINYQTLGISFDAMNSLTSRTNGFISKFIRLYENWNTNGGAPNCF